MNLGSTLSGKSPFPYNKISIVLSRKLYFYSYCCCSFAAETYTKKYAHVHIIIVHFHPTHLIFSEMSREKIKPCICFHNKYWEVGFHIHSDNIKGLFLARVISPNNLVPSNPNKKDPTFNINTHREVLY